MRAAKSVTYVKAVAPLQRPAGATSSRWNLKDSRGAAETRFAGLRCVLCMRPHLQPAFPCLAGSFSVWQSVDFVNKLRHAVLLYGMPQLVKRAFDKPVDGEEAPPPLPPSPVFAKILRIFGRKNCKGMIFALENGIFRRKNPPVPTVHAAGHD